LIDNHYDTEGKVFIYVRPGQGQLPQCLGVSPEDFWKNALEYIHPDDLERTLTQLGKKIGTTY